MCSDLERKVYINFDQYYISITIVQSYTGKYHEFVAVVLLRV